MDAFVWGMATYRMGIDAIQPDGSLTAEIGRGRLALHYQLYAFGPLGMLAELGEANGIDMYAMKNGTYSSERRACRAELPDSRVYQRTAFLNEALEGNLSISLFDPT